VPGDYNPELLDGSERLRFDGDRTGLNAACAADREVRLRGISAVTTPWLGNLVGLPGIAEPYGRRVRAVDLDAPSAHVPH
jgi:TPP-dependent 2-oxoacid decarboxylase